MDDATERTLALIKPDAVGNDDAGSILSDLGSAGFRLLSFRTLRLTEEQARSFYAVHQGKPFFERLVAFMTSGQLVAVVLEREHAVEVLREAVGATHPAEAAPDTIRARYGTGVPANAIHASDTRASARREIDFFFPDSDLSGTP